MEYLLLHISNVACELHSNRQISRGRSDTPLYKKQPKFTTGFTRILLYFLSYNLVFFCYVKLTYLYVLQLKLNILSLSEKYVYFVMFYEDLLFIPVHSGVLSAASSMTKKLNISMKIKYRDKITTSVSKGGKISKRDLFSQRAI